MVHPDSERAVAIARSILDGSIPLLLGCRRILEPLHRLGVARDEAFIAFVGVNSETDHLPLDPQERELWNKEMLLAKDLEIARLTSWAQPMAAKASHAVLMQFSKVE
jgi:hypothetical protein